MSRNDYFNRVRSDYPLSTKWLWLYAVICLPIQGFLFCFHTMLFAVNLNLNWSSYDMFAKASFFFVIAMNLVCLGYVYIVHLRFQVFHFRTYQLNIILLILTVCRSIIVMLLVPNMLELILLPVSVVWLVLNYFYLKKRKSIFSNSELTVAEDVVEEKW